MATTHLLYLHGFRSSPQSSKAQRMAARVRAEHPAVRWWCPQLPPSPRAAAALIDAGTADWPAEGMAVVGSSLGGYYATWLAERHDLDAVLVNPAVVAKLSPELFVGPHTFIYTGEPFEFTRAHVEELRALEVPALARPQRFWLLLETGDETLDYRHAVARYAGARQTVLEGGNHSFTRWNDYLDDIVDFCQ